MDGDLLGSIPHGALLARVLRLLVTGDRHEEFVGDLVEQANAELAGQPPSAIGRWLWRETLRSAPSLAVARVRRAIRRLTTISLPGTARPVPVLAGRFEQRSWSVPMAVSVSAHAIGIFVLLIATTLGEIETIDSPWVPVALKRAFLPAKALPTMPEAAPTPSEPRHHHKQHLAVRTPGPVMAPAPAVAPIEETTVADAEAPIEDPVERSIIIVVPPAVAEKRCLHCPSPTLPPAYRRLGATQQVVVKTCVGTKGDVTSVNVLRGAGALADASVVDTVRGWRFSPPAVGDHPVPFCYPTRFVFSMN